MKKTPLTLNSCTIFYQEAYASHGGSKHLIVAEKLKLIPIRLGEVGRDHSIARYQIWKQVGWRRGRLMLVVALKGQESESEVDDERSKIEIDNSGEIPW